MERELYTLTKLNSNSSEERTENQEAVCFLVESSHCVGIFMPHALETLTKIHGPEINITPMRRYEDAIKNLVYGYPELGLQHKKVYLDHLYSVREERLYSVCDYSWYGLITTEDDRLSDELVFNTRKAEEPLRVFNGLTYREAQDVLWWSIREICPTAEYIRTLFDLPIEEKIIYTEIVELSCTGRNDRNE